MFGDPGWLEGRTMQQVKRYDAWLSGLAGAKLAVVECGSGLAIPTVRYECERRGGFLIRINPRESDVPRGKVSLPLGALDALRRIDALLGETVAPRP
jgi:hypothetical protein